MQVNWIDLWGPTFTCPTMEHVGVVGDGGKWLCAVDKLLQRCVPTSLPASPQAPLLPPSWLPGPRVAPSEHPSAQLYQHGSTPRAGDDTSTVSRAQISRNRHKVARACHSVSIAVHAGVLAAPPWP